MQFLIRNKGTKQAAHIWLGTDTACRMWSTGGMDARRGYSVLEFKGERRICHMCTNVMNRQAAIESSLEQYRKAIMPAASSMRIDRPQEEIEHEQKEVAANRLPF